MTIVKYYTREIHVSTIMSIISSLRYRLRFNISHILKPKLNIVNQSILLFLCFAEKKKQPVTAIYEIPQPKKKCNQYFALIKHQLNLYLL